MEGCCARDSGKLRRKGFVSEDASGSVSERRLPSLGTMKQIGYLYMILLEGV